MKDYTGYKINMISVIEFSHKKDNSIYWNCLCDCGKKIILSSGNFNGKQKSCGCLRRRGGKLHQSWNGVGDISASFFSNLKAQANYRKIEFNIDINFIWDLFLKQNKKCALSGLDLYFTEKVIDADHNKGTASLDRIDSSVGYLKNNIQWIHKDINRMKQIFSQDKFIYYCNLISQNCKNKIKENTIERKDLNVFGN